MLQMTPRRQDGVRFDKVVTVPLPLAVAEALKAHAYTAGERPAALARRLVVEGLRARGRDPLAAIAMQEEQNHD